MQSEAAPGSRGALLDRQTLIFWLTIGLCTASVLLTRLLEGRNLPLWMDESFAVYFATLPDLPSFLDAIRRDTNPPFYFLLAWLWPFKGDDGFRFLSALFTVAAAVLPLAWPSRLTQYQRAAWAALLLIWLPGQLASVNARPGALLLFLGTAQTLAFMGVLERPSIRRAAIWAVLASAAVATHYFAAALGIAQGLVYLAVHRSRAVRTWPALLGLTPAVAVLAWHYPFLIGWLRPEVIWYKRLTLSSAVDALSWPIHSNWHPLALLGAVLIVCRFTKAEPQAAATRIAAATSAVTLVITVAAAFVWPMLVSRYLTPFVPGILLGVVLLARQPLGYAACAIIMAAFSGPAVVASQLASRSMFGFEDPARFLVAEKVKVVAVSGVRDGIVRAVGKRAMLSAIERPFRKAGLSTAIEIVPQVKKSAELTARGGPFLWVHGRGSPQVVPPGWRCYQSLQAVSCVPGATQKVRPGNPHAT